MEQEKTFSLIGRLIYDIRKENKIKMEDLCYGICSKSFLSRVELGKVQANNLLLEALFTRLGLDFPKELVPFSKEQNRRFEIEREIDNIADNRNPKRIELLKKYKEGSPLNKFEEQFCALTEGWFLNQFSEKLEDSLKIYEKGLKLTMPNFSLESEEMPQNLLSNLERAFIINIAHAEYYIYDFNKSDKIRHTKALQRMYFLKDYYEKHVKNFQKTKMYSIILFNLTNWIGLDGNFSEALNLAKQGFSLEKQSKFYYESHLYNIGYSYAALGNKEKAKPILEKAFSFMSLSDDFADIAELSKTLNQNFDFNFPINDKNDDKN